VVGDGGRGQSRFSWLWRAFLTAVGIFSRLFSFFTLHKLNLIKLNFVCVAGIICNSRTVAKDQMAWHRPTTVTKRPNPNFWHRQTVSRNKITISLIDFFALKT
jgi:hypothetical protein